MSSIDQYRSQSCAGYAFGRANPNQDLFSLVLSLAKQEFMLFWLHFDNGHFSITRPKMSGRWVRGLMRRGLR
jgi:hypothetical protein